MDRGRRLHEVVYLVPQNVSDKLSISIRRLNDIFQKMKNKEKNGQMKKLKNHLICFQRQSDLEMQLL